MQFSGLITELRGAVPKISITFCRTLINRAWREVREAGLWSFNLYEMAWATPPPVTVGTCAATQGSPIITFDLVQAVPALLASLIANPYSLLTQRQFRPQFAGGIYNIVQLDPAFAANGRATLDRMFLDPSQTAGNYQVYQVYYTPLFQDHLTFLSIRNPSMFLDLDLSKTRDWIDSRDPQRQWYQFPTHVVPFGRDTRPGSGTLGFPLYELWGQPFNNFTYQCYALRRGTDLVNPSDTLPFPIGDDLVLAKAYKYAYEWAEANRDQQPRSAGPDFKYLIGAKEDEYKKLLTLYRKQDRETVNNYFKVRTPDAASRAFGFFNTLAGVAGPYSQY